MANWKEKANSKLDKFVEDITTLEVVTLSGSLKLEDLSLTGAKLDFNNLLSRLKGDTARSSNIDMIAFTRIEVDKDVQQFVKANMTDEEARLFQMHLETVEIAQEARRATFQMLYNLATGREGLA